MANPGYDAVFVWDNLGPIHIDRLNAVAESKHVLAIELYTTSHEYAWTHKPESQFDQLTIADRRNRDPIEWVCFVLRLLINTVPKRSKAFFICHYERPYIFLLSAVLRLRGARVYVMQDSKFDDYPRYLWREAGKRLWYLPYQGALVGSDRTAAYLNFLGLKRTAIGYNSSSVARVAGFRAKERKALADRHFVVLARMIPKKNLTLALEAFAAYLRMTADRRRRLVFVGDGPDKATLADLAGRLKIAERVDFLGWKQEPEALERLSLAAALILPSVEEQFGNVVGEACALGIPVIVSQNCGAADRLVRPFFNGFALPPREPDTWARAMIYVTESAERWRGMSTISRALADEFWDAGNFARAAAELSNRGAV
jgi:L-malate glycosyltransferase